MQTKELFEFDKNYKTMLLAGCDEAGRGPLAGPVVVAACIMPYDKIIDGINDSKAVNQKKRKELYNQITEIALSYKIVAIDRDTIDRINILNATKLGMKLAIEGLTIVPDLVLVDAVNKLDVTLKYEPIIKGDAKSYAIAAASILAKVYRDEIMEKLDEQYPNYGFASNKGYPTPSHIKALEIWGKCVEHRQKFISGLKVKGE